MYKWWICKHILLESRKKNRTGVVVMDLKYLLVVESTLTNEMKISEGGNYEKSDKCL